jgi:hypothetical protein
MIKTTYSNVVETTFNVDDFIKEFQVHDTTAFSGYLLDIWKVL